MQSKSDVIKEKANKLREARERESGTVPAAVPVAQKIVSKDVVNAEKVVILDVPDSKAVSGSMQDVLHGKHKDFEDFLRKDGELLSGYVEAIQKKYGCTPCNQYLRLTSDDINLPGFVQYSTDSGLFLASDRYILSEQEIINMMAKFDAGMTEIPLIVTREFGPNEAEVMRINNFEVETLCKLGYDCKIESDGHNLSLVLKNEVVKDVAV